MSDMSRKPYETKRSKYVVNKSFIYGWHTVRDEIHDPKVVIHFILFTGRSVPRKVRVPPLTMIRLSKYLYSKVQYYSRFFFLFSSIHRHSSPLWLDTVDPLYKNSSTIKWSLDFLHSLHTQYVCRPLSRKVRFLGHVSTTLLYTTVVGWWILEQRKRDNPESGCWWENLEKTQYPRSSDVWRTGMRDIYYRGMRVRSSQDNLRSSLSVTT